MRRISTVLLYAGAGLCAVGALGIVGGMWVNLPPEAIRIIAMALPFAVGGSLFVAGAVVGRAARRPELSPEAATAEALGPGAPDWTRRSDRSSSREPAVRRDRTA